MLHANTVRSKIDIDSEESKIVNQLRSLRTKIYKIKHNGSSPLHTSSSEDGDPSTQNQMHRTERQKTKIHDSLREVISATARLKACRQIPESRIESKELLKESSIAMPKTETPNTISISPRNYSNIPEYMSLRSRELRSPKIADRFSRIEDEILSIRDTFKRVRQRLSSHHAPVVRSPNVNSLGSPKLNFSRSPQQAESIIMIQEAKISEQSEVEESSGQSRALHKINSQEDEEDAFEGLVSEADDNELDEQEEELIDENEEDSEFNARNASRLIFDSNSQSKDNVESHNQFSEISSDEEDVRNSVNRMMNYDSLKQRILSLENEKAMLSKKNIILQSYIYKKNEESNTIALNQGMKERCKAKYNSLVRSRVNNANREMIRDLII